MENIKEKIEEIVDKVKNDPDFATKFQENPVKAAEEIGFKAIGMKGDLTKIQKNNLPCLAHFIVNKQYKHFVVIYEINYKNKKVILMDPAKGKKIISFSEFNLLSTSYYIFLTPIKKLPIMIRF